MAKKKGAKEEGKKDAMDKMESKEPAEMKSMARKMKKNRRIMSSDGMMMS